MSKLRRLTVGLTAVCVSAAWPSIANAWEYRAPSKPNEYHRLSLETKGGAGSLFIVDGQIRTPRLQLQVSTTIHCRLTAERKTVGYISMDVRALDDGTVLNRWMRVAQRAGYETDFNFSGIDKQGARLRTKFVARKKKKRITLQSVLWETGTSSVEGKYKTRFGFDYVVYQILNAERAISISFNTSHPNIDSDTGSVSFHVSKSGANRTASTVVKACGLTPVW